MDKSTFLENRDHTGRFIVESIETGCRYFVEPVDAKGTPVPKHGDINPATGKLEGSYGLKYKGSIHPSESLITEENGFKNIVEIPARTSPYREIERIDNERYEQGWRPGSEHHNHGLVGSVPNE